MSTTAILMATYNGAQHIRAQLDSIINQTYTDWELYVSDDCSKDDTVRILKDYQQKDDRIVEIITNQGPHGAFNNYYSLIRYLKEKNKSFDYIFYCDQDDVWVSHKLERQISRLSACDKTKPALCYADLALTDETGTPSGKCISDYTDLSLSNPYNLYFKHRYIWGTAMAHNGALWDMLVLPEDINDGISHDNFLGKYAVSFGSVVYEPEPLVLYRRHSDNVSSMPKEHKFSKDFSLLDFFRYYKSVAFCSLYFVYHAPCQTEFMQGYANAVLHGGLRAYRFMKKYNIRVTEGFIPRIALLLMFVTGLIKREQRTINKEYLYEKNA